ncbi:MAG: nucleotide sugar dehydrogenase [Halobacteriota archaeon]
MGDKLKHALFKRGPIRSVGVVGMGYVGIPSAALFARSPTFDFVWGFQRNSPTSGYKIDMLNRGENPLKGEEPGLDTLIKEVVDANKFKCTADFSEIASLDAITVTVQTPFADAERLEPDLRPLIAGLTEVGTNMTAGALVSLESTVTPGTTGGLARRILEEKSGLVAGNDFALVHAPERVMVGRLIRNLQEQDRIVGGIDATSTERALELYRPLSTRGAIIQMRATEAEATKTAENAFRDLQIAAANELALHCEAMGINVYAVRSGIASLEGEGITRAILFPGAGVGGHCLTKDAYHLVRGGATSERSSDYPLTSKSLFVRAREINDFMPTHMFNLTVAALKRAGKTLRGANVAVLGWAFIQNSDDARNPPSAPFRRLVVQSGATVRVHDPYVRPDTVNALSADIEPVISDADAMAIFTAHDAYRSLDALEIKKWMGRLHPVVVDGRNIIDPDLFIESGFIYKGIGRGDKNDHPIQD